MPSNPTLKYPTLLKVFLPWAGRVAESKKTVTED